LNVILITLDTTRSDRLGCYGYKRNTSPHLDRLAEQSLLYTQATATSSWTLPSHASLFTGKFTSSHGARYDPEGPLRLTSALKDKSEWNQKFRARGLAKNELTLAKALKQKGFTTGAVVSGPWMKKIFGLNTGFDYYNDDNISSFHSKRASEVTSQALSWIKTIYEKPFFLFLNYFDPHYPYNPPGDFAHRFFPKSPHPGGKIPSMEEINYLYDAEILYTDYHLGLLFQQLKRMGIFDRTLLIVTADHGELLGEHGMVGHGTSLYQEELAIPLIIKYPGSEVSPRQDALRLQLVDIFSIILNRLQISLPPDVPGSGPSSGTHPIFAEVYPLPAVSDKGDVRALYEGKFKFHWNSKGNHLLFNLEEDPYEETNLLERYPELARTMESTINEFVSSLPKPAPTELHQEVDDDTVEALKSLGYL